MITITLADRSKPLLGKLVIDSPPNAAPSEVMAHVEPTPLGELVRSNWEAIASFHPAIRVIGFQLMEEHLHGALYVTRRLSKPLGNIIGGFKGGCTSAYRKLFPGQGKCPLFAEGFHDRILFQHGQLDRMLNYIRDNPRRSAVKRLFPGYFQQLREIRFGDGTFVGVGNNFLLDGPFFHQIQASRSITAEELAEKQKAMLSAAAAGAVVVSPCISKGERELARIAFEHQASLISLKNQGFSPLYKPSGEMFDACAEGRVLLLAPSQWPYTATKKPMTRADACVLNALAQQICGANAAAIHYTGKVPDNLPELVARAMGRNL